MISRSFVHALDDIATIQQEYNESMDFFESKFDLIEYYLKRRETLAYFESENDEVSILTESVSSGLSSIGDKIINMIKKLKDWITETIDKIKKSLFGESHDLDKIKALAKKDPELAAKKVKAAVMSGKMDVKDFKDMASFYKEIDQVLKELKKASVDPKSLQGRINKAKDFFADNKEVIIGAGTVATAVLSVAKLVDYFGKDRKKVMDNVEHAGQQSRKIASEIEAQVNHLKNLNSKEMSAVNGKNGKADASQINSKLNMLAKVQAANQLVTQGYISTGMQFINKFTNIIEKITPKSRGAGQKQLDRLEGMQKAQSENADRAKNAIEKQNSTPPTDKNMTITLKGDKYADAIKYQQVGSRNGRGNGRGGNGKGGKGGKP